MRKIYTLVIALTSMSIAINAQQVRNSAQALKKEINPEFSVEDSSVRPVNNAGMRDEGDTLWIDGFDDALLWELTTPDESLDPTESGWSIGSTNNSWYGVPALATDAPFARFVNGDPTMDPMTNYNGGPFTFTYTGTIPDLTGFPAPHLEFEQTGARFITNQEVQISTDGGATWQTAYSNNVIPPNIQGSPSLYPNPQTVRQNITSLVNQNPSNLLIRLFWDGAINGPDMNYIEYVWMVDNIRIVEGLANDLSISDFSYNSGFVPEETLNSRDLEYSIYPLAQLRPIVFRAMATNEGATTQTGAFLSVNITGPDTDVTLTSDQVDIAPSDSAIFIIEGFTPPANIGEYTVTFTLVQNEDDANLENNIGSRSFSVSDAVYARDRGGSSGTFNVGLEDFAAGPAYYIEETSQLYCIGAAVADVSDEGTYFDFQLYGADVFNFTADLIAFTEGGPVESAMLNAGGEENYTWLPLSGGPQTLNAGQDYAVMFHHYQGAEIANVAVSNDYAEPLTNFIYATFETQTCSPCFVDAGTFMVRMGLSQEFCDANEYVFSTSVEEIKEFAVNEIYPNPTSGLTTIEYTLLENANVQMFLFDNMGRVVMNKDMGTQSVGEYRFEHNFSQVASGSYTFSLKVNDNFINKKLVIK